MDLLDLAARQRWSSLRSRAEAKPEEIRRHDNGGLTPLHWVCFNRPPLSVIRALIDNSPTESEGSDGYLPPLVTLSDCHGTTPLHAACSSHASPHVIDALVTSFPPSVTLQDEMGWTPCHYLCGTAFASSSFSEQEGRDSLQSLQLLIRADPFCVDIIDAEGQTPLDLLCEVMGAHHDPGWQFGRRGRRQREGRNSPLISATDQFAELNVHGRESDFIAEECFFSLAKELVEAMYRNSLSISRGNMQMAESVGMPQILHQLLILTVPRDIIQYVLARFPEQAFECNNDYSKMLPLHIALNSRKQNGLVIADVLTANPNATKTRDAKGRFPLEYATHDKKKWNDGLEMVLRAYPEALQASGVRDSFLYPNILSKTLNDVGDLGHSRIDAAFRILRSKPDLLEL